ncbi:MAG: hypothetical protein LUF89_09135 [Ruminococcus sp.]|nr:hypothetical protein [Ruminococcus sp.]
MKTLKMIYTVSDCGKILEQTAYLSINDSNRKLLENDPESSLSQSLLRNVEKTLRSACVLQCCIFESMKCYKIIQREESDSCYAYPYDDIIEI